MIPEAAIAHLSRLKAVREAFTVRGYVSFRTLLANRYSVERILDLIGSTNSQPWNGFSPGSLLIQSIEVFPNHRDRRYEFAIQVEPVIELVPEETPRVNLLGLLEG